MFPALFAFSIAQGGEYLLVPTDRESRDYYPRLSDKREIIIDGRVYKLLDLINATAVTKDIYNTYVVPKVDFRSISLGEALAFLQKGIVDTHAQLSEKGVYTFSISTTGQASSKKISIYAENEKLQVILRNIATQTDCEVEFHGNGIYLIEKAKRN